MALAPTVPANRAASRPGRGLTWRSVILGGRQISVTSSYHSGGVGVAGRGGWHTGVDFAAAKGTSVRTPIGGTVVKAGPSGGAYGTEVFIKLNNGDYMRFGHLSATNVRAGDKIGAGTFIGKAGSTGNSSASHLHVEVMRASSKGNWRRSDSVFVDPVAYLNDRATALSLNPTRSRREDNPTGNTTTTVNVPYADTGFGEGVGKVKFTKKDFYQHLEAMFGDIDVLKGLDDELVAEQGGKSIEWAINQMVKNKVVNENIMMTYLNKTAWYKKYGAETTQRLIWEEQKPDYFKGEVDRVETALRATAAQIGFVLDEDEVQKIARQAYVYQWDQTKVLEAVANAGPTIDGGALGAALDDVETFAYLHGVEITDADRAQLREQGLAAGGSADAVKATAVQSLKDLLTERSAQKYAVFADQIRSGVNLRTAAGAYFSKAAELMEMDPDSIEFTDPLFRDGRAFTTTGPDGKLAQKTLWDFEREIKKDSRWLETGNAKTELTGMATGVLKTMGLM